MCFDVQLPNAGAAGQVIKEDKKKAYIPTVSPQADSRKL